MKKRILLIGPLPEPPLTGGIATGIQMMLDSDLKSKYEFILLNRSKGNIFQRQSLITLVKRQFRIIFKLIFLVIQHRPNVVHIKTSSYLNFFTSSLYIFVAKCLLSKTILQIHGGGFPSWYNKLSKFKKTAIKYSLKLPDRVFVLSSYWVQFLSRMITKEKITIVPNGVKLRDFIPNCEQTNLANWSINHTAVLFIGSPDRKANIDKGFYDVLKAFRIVHQKVNRTILFLAGFDESFHNFEISRFFRNEAMKEHSCFLGIIHGQKKIEAFSKADIFILPSYYENMPNTVLEAMAAGLPIVSSPVGAIPEMVEEGVNGFLVKAGDYENLSKKILDLVRDPQLRKRMGEANLREVRLKYDFKVIAAKLEREYEYLIRS